MPEYKFYKTSTTNCRYKMGVYRNMFIIKVLKYDIIYK